MAARCNVVISGATSSGKTSLLSSLLGLIDPAERVVTLEDTAELAPAVDHLVRLEARPGSADGVRPIDLDQLVRTALRLRPDRLVVGEVRGAEVLGLVQALNTGHDGSLSTVHANSALDALHRLETLVVQSAPSWPLPAIRQHLSRCIDVVVHVERRPGGARRVIEVGEVGPVTGADARLVGRAARAGPPARPYPSLGGAVSPVLAALCPALAVLVVGGRVRAWLPAVRGGGAAEVRRPARRTRLRRARPVSNVEAAAWCDDLARALRAGATLGRAIVDVTGEHPGVAVVMAPVLRAMERGHPVATGLTTVEHDPGALGLALVVLQSCSELGGPAAAPLERVAATLRTRAAIEDEHQAHSAQARLSAQVLTLVPVALLALLAVTEPNVRGALATQRGDDRRGCGRALQRGRVVVDAAHHRVPAMNGVGRRRGRRRGRRHRRGGTACDGAGHRGCRSLGR